MNIGLKNLKNFSKPYKESAKTADIVNEREKQKEIFTKQKVFFCDT